MTNAFITLSGEALYHFKCKEVTADIDESVIKDLDNQPICYNAIRAKLEGKSIFIKPRNRVVTEFSQQIPCNNLFPPLYSSIDDEKWVKVDDTGVTTAKRPDPFMKMFHLNKNINITHVGIDFSSSGEYIPPSRSK